MSPSDRILDPPPAAAGFGVRAARGAAMAGLAQGVKLVVQIMSVIALSRLLSPRDFGLVAMVGPIIAFTNIVQNLGLSQAVVVSRTLTQGQASAMFWINALLSFTLAALIALSSPLIAAFYGQEEVAALVAVLAVGIFTAGLGSQHFGMATRTMRFGRLAMVDMASVILGFTAALLWALTDPGPWALVAASVTSSLVSLSGAWIASGWRPGRPAPYRQVASLLRFGGGLTTYNLSNYLARNLDNVLIGRVHGASTLGLYDRAYKLLLFPLQQITFPLARVMVPTLSRLVDEPDRYRSAYCRTVGQILLVALPGVIAVAIVADVAVPFLLGPSWGAAVPIFRWLALAAVHQLMTATLGWLFVSQSRMRQYARWGIFSALTCGAAFVIGLPFGAVSVAAAYALSDVFLRMPLLWRLAGSRGPVRTGDLVRLAAPFAVAGTLAGIALLLARPYLPSPPLALLVGAVAITYLIAWGVLALSHAGRTTLREGIGMARQVLAG